jgi:hypothetical protein
MTTILQIVPQTPGSFDGVGDYALGLAKALSANHGCQTVFAVAKSMASGAKHEFPIIAGLHSTLASDLACEHVILHYANYGYQSRGVPLGLRKFARALRKKLRGRWITVFHELYAFGPPWKSAFWLYPLQARIAHDMIDISDACVVSSDTIEAAIHTHDPEKRVHLLPVMSNFGEPANPISTSRSPRRWAICGGERLIRRSLRSFVAAQRMIPGAFFPEKLEIIGGPQSAAARAAIRQVERMISSTSCRYYPEVTASVASDLLRACSFAWIDYFGKGKVWPGMIFKSGSFAACCAHGVLPIVSHDEPPPALNGEPFPDWSYITPHGARFPEAAEIGAMSEQIYAWYHRHASAACAARAYAEVLA